MSRSVVPWRVLSRSNLSYPSRRSSLNPRPVNLLQPLWRRQKSQLLCNQANPASFCKTPGEGLPLRRLVPCTEAQKCLFVNPLFATLTHSLSLNSFLCHSYANTPDGRVTPCHSGSAHPMLHVTPLSPVPPLACASFLSSLFF